MRLPAPMVKPPRILAPAPTVTLSPRVGWRFSRRTLVPPRVTPWSRRHVLADLRRLADDDAHAVVDEEARPELGRGMDLDAR